MAASEIRPESTLDKPSLFEKAKSFFIQDKEDVTPQVKGFTSAKGKHRTKLTKIVFGYFFL